MSVIDEFFVDGCQVFVFAVDSLPQAALLDQCAALLAHCCQIVVHCANDFLLQISNRVALRSIDEPRFPHFEHRLVRQAEEVDFSQLHLADDLAIVLLHTDSLEEVLWLRLIAAIIANEAIQDVPSDKYEVNAFTLPFLDLIVLPLIPNHLLDNLIVLLVLEQREEVDAARVFA